jgi:hypothetical protein
MNIVEVELDSLDLRYAKLRARRPVLEKRLMASLEEAGQHSPVIVVGAEEPGRWVLIEGRKRVRALKRLKAEAVNAVVWELAPPQALIAAYQLQDGRIGNVALGLVRQLPQTCTYDTQADIRAMIERAWGRCSERLGMLAKTAEAVFTMEETSHAG